MTLYYEQVKPYSFEFVTRKVSSPLNLFGLAIRMKVFNVRKITKSNPWQDTKYINCDSQTSEKYKTIFNTC